MSRVGRRPVPIPAGVSVAVAGTLVTVKGPKGELKQSMHPEMAVAVEGAEVKVARPSDEGRHRALHGLTRALIRNMVDGVTKGYTKSLEIQGVGYKAEPIAGGLRLALGFSHPVEYKAPVGIKLTVDNNTVVKVDGIDKALVGQVAAELRKIRPPEPYKGKGIRYVGEHVRRKAGKTGAKT
ncbi:MAG: 50S ribosomal protein L6 [Gemmatimonadetes bacterium RBG_16_66_8]|nr:MAG: 50S ribosomal protein L6 [Gemmatimonadetes bacterium RBG_16_66_8]